jgi:hypothetical protein
MPEGSSRRAMEFDLKLYLKGLKVLLILKKSIWEKKNIHLVKKIKGLLRVQKT